MMPLSVSLSTGMELNGNGMTVKNAERLKKKKKEKDKKRQDKTNVYYNGGSQEAGLVKQRLHKMNSIEEKEEDFTCQVNKQHYYKNATVK